MNNSKIDDVSSEETPSSETKKRALKVALCLFTTQGFDATPTAQISKEANISTGTLFHYFPNKNSILEQLYLSVKKEMSVNVRKNDDPSLPTKKRLFTCLRSYTDWAIANPEKSLFLDQFYHSANISQKIKQEAYDEFDWMKEIVKAALQEGILRELPLEFHLVMIACIINGLMSLAKSGKTELSTDQLIEFGLEMLLKN
jgi:AcrR family transcriptional regulator